MMAASGEGTGFLNKFWQALWHCPCAGLGLRLGARSPSGLSRLTCHCRSARHTECVAYLLAHGADVYAQNSKGDNAMHISAKHGNAGPLQALLSFRPHADGEDGSQLLGDIVVQGDAGPTRFIDLHNGEARVCPCWTVCMRGCGLQSSILSLSQSSIAILCEAEREENEQLVLIAWRARGLKRTTALRRLRIDSAAFSRAQGQPHSAEGAAQDGCLCGRCDSLGGAQPAAVAWIHSAAHCCGTGPRWLCCSSPGAPDWHPRCAHGHEPEAHLQHNAMCCIPQCAAHVRMYKDLHDTHGLAGDLSW